jgi:hypothetical protein
MKDLKHTPGPWKVINGWDSEGKGKFFPSVVIMGTGKENDLYEQKRIVINVSHDQQAASIMANAKLMAASPDLIKAALYAIDLLGHQLKKPFKERNYGHYIFKSKRGKHRSKINCLRNGKKGC